MSSRHCWQDAVIYHVYPRSFRDNNGDGVGDLPGLVEKVDHLQGTCLSLHSCRSGTAGLLHRWPTGVGVDSRSFEAGSKEATASYSLRVGRGSCGSKPFAAGHADRRLSPPCRRQIASRVDQLFLATIAPASFGGARAGRCTSYAVVRHAGGLRRRHSAALGSWSVIGRRREIYQNVDLHSVG